MNYKERLIKNTNTFLSKFNIKFSRVNNYQNTLDPFLKEIIDRGHYLFFFDGNLEFYQNLKSIGFNFFFTEDGNIIAQFINYKMYIQSIEDMYILNEIYFEGIYNFSLPSKCILLDIGMNVGFSSLFFASFENIQKIFSFEPIPSTFQQGLENFALNPLIKNKIDPSNYGIGANTRIEHFDFSREWKGSVGLRGLSKEKRESSSKIEVIEVQIKSIRDLINNAKTYGLPIVAKIDCEGAEYEILELLNKIDEVKSFDFFMIEWHDKGPQELTKILQKSNFSTLTFKPYLKKNVGMIYAFKNI